jgi:hypothetical protein
MAARKQSLLERLETKFLVGDECWEWTGRRSSRGYGAFDLSARQSAPAHRVLYELLVGPIPAGLELDHLCRVRHCVRPDHLEPVTHQENCRRAAQHDAWYRPVTRDRCGKGHALTPDNLWTFPGGRRCRTCALEVKRRYKARKKERDRETSTPEAPPRAGGLVVETEIR